MLLHLPPEIRDQIYRLLFHDITVNGPDKDFSRRDAVSLFLTSRQIALEAPFYLYSRTFIFEEDSRETSWQRAYRFMIRLDERYRHQLRLRIHFPDHVFVRRTLAISVNHEINTHGGHRSRTDEYIDEWIVEIFKLAPAAIELVPRQGWLPGVRVLEAKTWSTALPELLELYRKAYCPGLQIIWHAQDWPHAKLVGWHGANGLYHWAR